MIFGRVTLKDQKCEKKKNEDDQKCVFTYYQLEVDIVPFSLKGNITKHLKDL